MKDANFIQLSLIRFMMKKPRHIESMNANASMKARAIPLMKELVDLY